MEADATPPGQDNDKERAGIQSVEVGFALLDALAAADGSMMLRDLAHAAGMSAAKAHRYLVSFQRLGLVAQDLPSNRYDLGPAALRLGLAGLMRLDPVRLARERLPQLAEEIGHALALAVWGNHGPTLVHWQDSHDSVTVNLRLGDVMPLLSSATGRCFAAWQNPAAMAPLLARELERARSAGYVGVPRTQAELDALLAEVRERGMARVVDTLLQGVSGFCAPVFDSSGHLVMGVVTLGAVAQFDADYEGPVGLALGAFARQLSRDLGHPK